jgi:hypothetical protein
MGVKFATVGVLYAVLLAFAVVVVWEKFNQAESEVALIKRAANRKKSAHPELY